MQKLLGHAEFALYSVVVQPEKFIDFSHDGRELSGAVSRLGQRGRETGAQLMEAIEQATKDVQHEDRRPAILVMRLGGEAASRSPATTCAKSCGRAAPVLYVVSAAGAQGSAPPQARGTDAVSIQQGQIRDAELAEGQFNLNQVLDDGAKESGGTARSGHRHDACKGRRAGRGGAAASVPRSSTRCPMAASLATRLSVTTKRKGSRFTRRHACPRDFQGSSA